MRDNDIRKVLLKDLHKEHINDSNTLIIEELGLCQGESRVDLAVINGTIHGYEIKSEKDSLKRLHGQQSFYNRILDFVTVIASERHLSKIEKQVPIWWGLALAHQEKTHLKIVPVRQSNSNPYIDPCALVQLLWRDETLSILTELGIDKGVRSKPRTILWDRLVENTTIEFLKTRIRELLKSRSNWRPT